MKYIVPIIHDSIQKNPHAGRTLRPSDWEYTFTCVGQLPDFFNHGENVIIESRKNFISLGDEKKQTIKGKIIDTTILSKCSNLSINQSRSFTEHPPEADYFYKHQDITIECAYCGEYSKLSELYNIDGLDGDGNDIILDNVCPHCHEPDCCELEYEKLK